MKLALRWVLSLVCLTCLNAAAQNSDQAMQEIMKRMEAAATPGSEHKLLAEMAGEWDVETTMWWGAPDAPPSKSKGKASQKMILGGRYLQGDFEGEAMGRPMKGLGLTGYDNFNKKYVSVWIDDLGTAVTTSEGSADASGKVLTFNGKMDDPGTGEKQKPFKIIIRIQSADKHAFEMHDLALGEKSKIMEMIYTRRK
jgi:hypothetical protein